MNAHMDVVINTDKVCEVIQSDSDVSDGTGSESETEKKLQSKVPSKRHLKMKEDGTYVISQSNGLSKRHKKMKADGHHLNDDSKHSENTLTTAMRAIVEYAKEKAEKIGGVISVKKTMTLYELQEHLHKIGGPSPNPDPKNKKVNIKPDGGIIIMQLCDKMYPILIVEDKVQGTNDNLFKNGKKKQATGNAIERGAKNMKAADMLYAGLEYFSYVLFASGCDFHSSETIAKRIEMMNMGVPNHSIDISPKTSRDIIMAQIVNTIIPAINIKKMCGQYSIASAFVKAHKWNEMEHSSSRWTAEEIVEICKSVVDKVFEYIR